MDDRAERDAGKIILTEPEKAPSGDVHSLLRRYVQETKQQSELAEQPPINNRTIPRIYLALRIIRLLAVVGIAVGVWALIEDDPAAPSAARSLDLTERQLCAERQEAVMRAITQYVADHKEAPKDLSELQSQYLAVPPVDPISGIPYHYVHVGNSVSLSCAKHPLFPQLAPQAAAPARPPHVATEQP